MIDTHHHFWTYCPETHGWISDDMAAIRRDFGPQDLKPVLEVSGVRGVISVEARADPKENDLLLGEAVRHDWILGVVGRAPISRGEGETAAALDALSSNCWLKGIRQGIQGRPPGYARHPDFVSGVGALEHEYMLPQLRRAGDGQPASRDLGAILEEKKRAVG